MHPNAVKVMAELGVNIQLHIGFEDPDEVTGTDKENLLEFRRIRNEILRDFFTFYQTKLKA